MSKPKLDLVELSRLKFDTDKNADRVTLADLDVDIELSAEDGDSVIIKKHNELIPIQSGQVIDLSMVSKIMLVGDVAQASLRLIHEGQELYAMTILKGEVKEICLTEVLVEFAGQSAFLVIS